MTLPNLPKKYKRHEAKYDSVVAKKLVELHPHKNWALETKLVGGKLLSHQRTALKQVENGKFKPYKIRDVGTKNPFDYFYLGDADAIVCYIDVDKRQVDCEVNGGVVKYNFKL